MIFIYPDGGTTNVSPGGSIKGLRRLGKRPEAVQLSYFDLKSMLDWAAKEDPTSLYRRLAHLRNTLAIPEVESALEQLEQPDGSGT